MRVAIAWLLPTLPMSMQVLTKAPGAGCSMASREREKAEVGFFVTVEGAAATSGQRLQLPKSFLSLSFHIDEF